jgi:outer membrane protein assembly factor BamA
MNKARTAFVIFLLLPMIAGTAHARKKRFVRGVVIVSATTPAPATGRSWEQVSRRGSLDDVLQHPTPSYRMFWLPVPYDEMLMAADTTGIVSYYRNQGYLDVSIVSAGLEPIRGERKTPINYIIIVVDGISEESRYRLTDVQLRGVRSLDSLDLKNTFARRHGRKRFYSPARAADNLLLLRSRYADAGFLDTTAVSITQVPIIDRSAHTVIERYLIHERRPLTVGGFHVVNLDSGNLITDRATIAKAAWDARLRPGFILRRQNILDAEGHLLDLGVFRRAQVSLDTARTDTAVRGLRIEVSEREPGEFRTRFGYSSVEKWRVSQAVLYHNFLGQARLIGIEGEASLQKQYIAARYGQPRIEFPGFLPWVGGNSDRVRYDQQISVEWERIDLETADGTGTTDRRDRSIGTTIMISQRFGRMARLGVSYELSRKGIDIPSPLSAGKSVDFQGNMSLTGLYDSRDDFLLPTRGQSLSARTDLLNLGIGSRTLHASTELLASTYHRVGKHLVFAVTGGTGFMYVTGSTADDQAIVESESFWKSRYTAPVRGFRRDDITSGSPAIAYWLAKAELRLDMWSRVGLAIFADVGDGWTLAPGNTGFDAFDPGRTVYSAGFGPRVNLALPFRLDFVRQLIRPAGVDGDGLPYKAGWKLEFGIGQAF